MQKRYIKLLLSLVITIDFIGCANTMPTAKNDIKPYYNQKIGDYAYCSSESCPQPTQFTLDNEPEQVPIFINKSIPPTTVEVPRKLVESIKVHFDFSKSTLRKHEMTKLSNQFAKLKSKNIEVVITGYTDNIEDASKKKGFNKHLALQRAEVVQQLIIDKFAIPEKNIKIDGKPLCCYVSSNKTSSGRAENRRSEVQIYITE